MDWAPLLISLRTATCATVITFFLGIFAAHKVRALRGGVLWIVDGLFTLPLVLPPTVAGFFLLLLFGKNGLLGKLLSQIGIQIIFKWPATVIAAIVIAFPLMYRSTKAAFEQIDQNLVYAARTLGMSEIKIFWKVIMPLALPGVISGGILAFARALGEFGATLMIAGNIPKVTQTIPVAIYMATQGNDMEKAMLWVAIIVIISFGVVFFMNYLPIRKRRFGKSKVRRGKR
ncbi:molybdenum ABC transporter permease subunit [Anaerocolumna cellulosilytica]|uniref:Molybdenum transport system permease n=1 Tax=Anaerocolumna cellulosilytica TaxID=433286 RepID=A0A6S6R504_9FIRM|nr:molybdate ABC transporter permease subunit [Anaerocolumna cellulosilytica]MBB5197963.1 molybdate transport system permease protein [Anaerocolumna cellulosilytica]BCJ95157.1 molybdenum ABC transporter permease subunit [Anaerocolumna cellulosilytica]